MSDLTKQEIEAAKAHLRIALETRSQAAVRAALDTLKGKLK